MEDQIYSRFFRSTCDSAVDARKCVQWEYTGIQVPLAQELYDEYEVSLCISLPSCKIVSRLFHSIFLPREGRAVNFGYMIKLNVFTFSRENKTGPFSSEAQ